MTYNKEQRVTETIQTHYTNVTCDKCNKSLTESSNLFDTTNLGRENTLIVALRGGYGMFIDPSIYEQDTDKYTKILCHGCAHKLYEWLNIQTENYHTCT